MVSRVASGTEATGDCNRMNPKDIANLSNYKLYEMLLSGELHERIGYGVRYMAIVDRLVNAGYDVAQYKHRVISWKSK